MAIDKRKYADRAEYLKAAVKKRRKVLKQRAVEYKGGKGNNKKLAESEKRIR